MKAPKSLHVTDWEDRLGSACGMSVVEREWHYGRFLLDISQVVTETAIK